MKVTLIGNAGVWLRDTGLSVLIDGLYGKNEFFSEPLQEMNAAAAGTTPMFRHIRTLLFTHRHEDHFNAAYVNTYLMHNTVQNVYIPKLTVPPNQYEDPGIVVPGRSGARIFSVGEHDEEIYYDRISDDGWVIFFKTIHMGGSQYDARHYGIIVVSSGYSYLFMADTDWTYAVKNVVQLLKDTTLKAAFVNPLSYMDARGKEWLSYLHVPNVVIYHVPYEGSDKSGMRKLVQREWASPVSRSWKLQALTEKMQTITI